MARQLPESEGKAILQLFRTMAERLAEKRKEERRLRPLEQRLKQHIVGQKVPIDAVAAAIRRKQNGWHDEDHPLVFLFLGSSGVGKTELAKRLAEFTNDSADNFIRIDMSEFQSKHEVAKFIGAPPGYVGHEQGGQLTERLKKCPNAVVLLDEIEKAHPDVLTVMLQLFDEGRLTDGQGNTVQAKDAIFVCTSNLAQQEIADHAMTLRRESQDGAFVPRSMCILMSVLSPVSVVPSEDFVLNVVHPILRRAFKRDEFVGRINEVLFFLPFSDAELDALVQMQLRKWEGRARERHQIKLQWTQDAVRLLRNGYNIRYGARSIQHEVEKKVVNLLARAHEDSAIASVPSVCSPAGLVPSDCEQGSTVTVAVENGRICLRREETPADAKSRNSSDLLTAIKQRLGKKRDADCNDVPE
ncbi:MAG: hypothetical protein MHM6MM_008220 [Cercozoa sp. M6MM]